MQLFELEEGLDIIKNINGLLNIFGATEKTRTIIIEYLKNILIEMQSDEVIDKVEEETGEEINFDEQVKLVNYLISILEEKNKTIIVDKELN